MHLINIWWRPNEGSQAFFWCSAQGQLYSQDWDSTHVADATGEEKAESSEPAESQRVDGGEEDIRQKFSHSQNQLEQPENSPWDTVMTLYFIINETALRAVDAGFLTKLLNYEVSQDAFGKPASTSIRKNK